MADTFVIVGGDAAGMSAASKAKRENPDLDVVVFEKGEWVSYGACGLPYYVKGEIEELEEIIAVPKERFIEERGIDLRTNHEVTGIDTEAKSVTVETPDAVIEQSYDSLLIATGANAIVPPFDGIDLEEIYTIHDPPSGRALREAVERPEPDRPQTVGIVGGGYIGIEMAEAFRGQGLDVHVFEMLDHVLDPFGEMVGEAVEEELRDNGVTLHLGTRVEGFDGEERVEAVRTESDAVPVDMVVIGVGVNANATIADEAGIEIGDTGAIAVDEFGETSAPDVYAAGDCAEAEHVVTGEPDHVPLALTANRAGRAVGQTVTGDPTPTGPIAGTAVVKAFDLEAGRTGIIDEERAREAGFDPVSVSITSKSRAGYYPGGSAIEIELVADADSKRVLGAAMVGEEGVTKRVDTVTTAIYAEMDTSQVEYLDLSYAPPFGPTWDPVLTAAKVLNSKLDG
ncbi:MAG: FAD-dependent oxidoreductase [Halobacteriota archaeon]